MLGVFFFFFLPLPSQSIKSQTNGGWIRSRRECNYFRLANNKTESENFFFFFFDHIFDQPFVWEG